MMLLRIGFGLICLSLACSIFAEELPHSVLLHADGTPVVGGVKDDGVVRYWTDVGTNTIRKSDFNGADEQVFLSNLETPYGIAFDTQYQRFIWTSSSAEVVRSSSVDGSVYVDLTSSFEPPFTIVVEYSQGPAQSLQTGARLQSSDSGDYQIAYTLNGNQIQKITQYSESTENVTETLGQLDDSFTPWGLAYDPGYQQLYIGDQWGRMVKSLQIPSRTLRQLAYHEYSPDPKPPKPIESPVLPGSVEAGE